MTLDEWRLRNEEWLQKSPVLLLRRSLGLTRDEMASQVSLSTATLQNLEKGHNMGRKSAAALAAVDPSIQTRWEQWVQERPFLRMAS